MNLIKKLFVYTMVFTMCMAFAPISSIAAEGDLVAGTLVKRPDMSSVYYLYDDAGTLKRMTFPNSATYFSWFEDFDAVVTITAEELGSVPLGKNAVYRPGTRLIKITTDPKVYAVEKGGLLRWIDSEETAAALYGDDWASLIDDVPDAFYASNYNSDNAVDDKVTADAHPAGTLFSYTDSSDIYYVAADGTKRMVTEEGFTANTFNADYVITGVADTITYTNGTSITEAEADLFSIAEGGLSVTPVVTGDLEVSLSSSTPTPMTIPSSASNVVFAKYVFATNADGAATINSIQFERTGVGAPGDIANMYLYEGEERLTTGRSINSSSNLVIFNNVNYEIPAGTTKTLSLVADIGAGKSGHHAFRILNANAITTDSDVSGSFPVSGNILSLNANDVGIATVTEGSDPGNITAGSGDVELTSFTVAISSTEDATVERVTLYHAGTVSNSNLSGFELKQGGTTLATTDVINSDGNLTLEFDEPYEITKGNSKKFYIYGDVSSEARDAQTVRFYMESNADIKAIGATYDHALTVAIGSTNSAGTTGAAGTYDGTSSAKYTETTVEAGDVTVATSGPTATNIPNNSDDQVFLNFSITSQSNADIKALQLEIHAHNFAGLDLDAGGVTVTGDYITDIKITDTDSDQVIWGSVDLSSFVDAGAGTNDGVGYNFTDTVSLTAGVTRNFQVTADISSSVIADSTFTFLIGDEADSNTLTATAVKSTDTNTYLTGIVPGTYSAGNQMTIKIGALEIARSTYVPLAQDIVRGSIGVEAASLSFNAAASGADLKVSQIKLSGYVDAFSGTAGLTKDQTVASEGTLAVKDIINNVRIYEKAGDGTLTQLGVPKSFNSSGEATFTSLNWKIDKEDSKTLLVKVDVSSGISTILDYGEDDLDRFAIDITTVADDISVETYDKGIAVTATGDLANAATGTTGAQVTVREAGTIISDDGTEPIAGLVIAGTNNASFDQLRFTTTYEDLVIAKLRVKRNSGTISNLTAIVLSYTNSNGDAVTATKEFNGNNADFTGLDIYVTKDEYAYVEVGANVKTVASGATAGTNVTLVIDATTSFEANGVGNSSTKLTAISTNGATASNAMTIVKSKPIFATQTLDTTALSSGVEQQIYKFSITASGGSDVSIKQLPFQVNVTDANDGMYLHTIRLKRIATNGVPESTNLNGTLMNIDGDGYLTSNSNGVLNTAYPSSGKYPWGDDSNSRTMAVIFDTTASYSGVTAGDSKGEETILAGTTKEFALVATVGGVLSAGDSVACYMPIQENEDAFESGKLIDDWDDPDEIFDLAVAGLQADYIWSDNSSGTSHSANYDAATPSSDWFNGYYFTQTSAVSRSY